MVLVFIIWIYDKYMENYIISSTYTGKTNITKNNTIWNNYSYSYLIS